MLVDTYTSDDLKHPLERTDVWYLLATKLLLSAPVGRADFPLTF